MLNKVKSKKAQVGDTVTWIVATIIIVVMLFLFVFGASLLAETKNVQEYKEKITSSKSSFEYDLFLSKSLYSYNILDDAKKKNTIYKKLEELELNNLFSQSIDERDAEIKARLIK